jgi:hypothetical protein
VGFIAFGGFMLVLAGVFHAIAGLAALLRTGYYLVPAQNLLVSVDYSAWGWVHLLIGVFAAACGYGVLTGHGWARISGIGLAALSAIVNLAFLPAYPLWSLMIIAFDVLIIYALVVHGREAVL